ncbi:hypothetical protein FHT76_007598 [Rhizobium sp. BK176]|nr:hypothetical protein [Rhizobium sp. BK661]MCS4095877.1 hypothetical protein [Rhizobium sp. BK176]
MAKQAERAAIATPREERRVERERLKLEEQKRLTDRICEFWRKVHEASGTSTSGSGESSGTASGEDVIDADFEEVDKNGQRHG